MGENEKELSVVSHPTGEAGEVSHVTDTKEQPSIITVTPTEKEILLDGTIKQMMSKLDHFEKETRLIKGALKRCWEKFPYAESFFRKYLELEIALEKKAELAELTRVEKILEDEIKKEGV